MKYCLNITTLLGNANFRLLHDGSWGKCENPTSMESDAFIFTSKSELDKQQKSNLEVIDKGIKYIVKPELGLDVGSRTELDYLVYGFHESFPDLPVRKQLEETMIMGDDQKFNTLVLKVDGKFYLMNPKNLAGKINSEVVVQFESFVPGNEYVGLSIVDSNFDEYIMDYFRTALHFWRDHLVFKIMHQHSDTYEVANLDALLDIYTDLEKIKNSWNHSQS